MGTVKLAYLLKMENAMPYDPNKHHRHSIRLRGYDYSQAGMYFVTICAQGRECLFGQVADNTFQPNACGLIVAECLDALPGHFEYVSLDACVVMPNHMHAIVVLGDAAGAERPTLGRVVAYLKYESTKRINDLQGTQALRVWQRNYHEHIIRDARALSQIREYIANNPRKWEQDRLWPGIQSKW